MAETQTIPCAQCGKPALAAVNNIPLCVEHYSMFQNANLNHLRHLMAMMNHAENQMAAVSGMPWLAKNVAIPPLPTGAITLNNIHVNNSTIGSINTGTVQSIDVNIGQLHKIGNDKAKEAIKLLAEAVLNDKATPDNQRNEILDQIEFISSQAALAPSERKPGLVKGALLGIGQAATTITALAGAWQAAEPILKGLFP